ncbi:MAG: response regulator transcription factor [Ilumatobacteraceae bacterium]
MLRADWRRGAPLTKLLLIEDDARIAAAITRGLEAEGFTVQVSSDGDDGFWRATEGSYDLVLLDLMLPRRNGFRVCADLRAAGVSTPVLVLTAKDGDLDEAEALDTGADDYLVKPFSFPVLVARVRALLRPAGGRPPTPVRVGALRVEPAMRRVWFGDVEVELTAREFQVFEFLVRRRRPAATARRRPAPPRPFRRPHRAAAPPTRRPRRSGARRGGPAARHDGPVDRHLGRDCGADPW